jgi:hypothetical protein
MLNLEHNIQAIVAHEVPMCSFLCQGGKDSF